jgi:Ca-activated chloride channel family protein
VTQPEITITAPATVLAGSKFEVSWTGTVNAQDYINIVPMGTDEGTFGNYLSVRDNAKDMLQAPSETGIYELRYVLRAGIKTMATATVEVTEPEVTISAPEEVRAGDKLRVSWTGTVSSNDYINLVPVGSEDDAFGVYSQVGDNTERDLKVPDEIGLYEVRYLLREGSRVLARQTVEVLASDAPLESGANLQAPDIAAPGSTIEVSWSADSAGSDQRITIARSEQAIFTWISAEKISGEPPMQITLPDDQGVYEIRLPDLSSQSVLARRIIKVE